MLYKKLLELINILNKFDIEYHIETESNEFNIEFYTIDNLNYENKLFSLFDSLQTEFELAFNQIKFVTYHNTNRGLFFEELTEILIILKNQSIRTSFRKDFNFFTIFFNDKFYYNTEEFQLIKKVLDNIYNLKNVNILFNKLSLSSKFL